MADLVGASPVADAAGGPELRVTSATAPDGTVTIRVTVRGDGTHDLALRAEGLDVREPVRRVTLRPGRPATVEWTARAASPDVPWVAVVIPDGDAARRREVMR
jgi:hypothetical protein